MTIYPADRLLKCVKPNKRSGIKVNRKAKQINSREQNVYLNYFSSKVLWIYYNRLELS